MLDGFIDDLAPAVGEFAAPTGYVPRYLDQDA